MGRPPLGMDKRKLSVKVALNRFEAMDLSNAAKAQGFPVARFIREAAVRAAAEILGLVSEEGPAD